MSNNSENSKLSRRNFITSAGSFALGAVATGVGLNVLGSSGEPKAVAVSEAVADWPLYEHYEKIDPEVVLEKAYQCYHYGPG